MTIKRIIKLRHHIVPRKILVTALFALMINTFCLGQYNPYIFNFDEIIIGNDYREFFIFENTNGNNIWQVGKPNKTLFDTACTKPNALVTDTLNTYPPNNLSSVIMWVIFDHNPAVEVFFSHRINSDTLADYGKIEVSYDNGLSWDDVHNWLTSKPVFSGNSEWTHSCFEVVPHDQNMNYGDTLRFKFTFTSDNIDNAKEGWMIDDIFITFTQGIGIKELNDNKLFEVIYIGGGVFDFLCIETTCIEEYVVSVFDLNGKEIFTKKIKDETHSTFSVPNISEGVYIYRIGNGKKVLQRGKLMIY